jgi:hypothetical protein
MTTDQFKETCNAQNIEGFSKATFGTGCPAGGKKCNQGGGIVAYYYGAAAEVNSCLDEYSDDNSGSADSDYSSPKIRAVARRQSRGVSILARLFLPAILIVAKSVNCQVT